ncbi:hypothetical protein HK100_006513, partial [Physocladia obscura]
MNVISIAKIAVTAAVVTIQKYPQPQYNNTTTIAAESSLYFSPKLIKITTVLTTKSKVIIGSVPSTLVSNLKLFVRT